MNFLQAIFLFNNYQLNKEMTKYGTICHCLKWLNIRKATIIIKELPIFNKYFKKEMNDL